MLNRFLKIICLLSLSASILATDYYVDDVASNGNGSFESPFNNFPSALNAAQPGDVIYVMPGTYQLSAAISTVRDGAANQRITLRAYDPADRPYISALGRLLSISHAYTTIDGLILDGQFGDSDAVRLRGNADYAIIRNCEIKNGTRDGIDMDAVDNVLIENCEIHHFLAGTYNNQRDAHGIVATGEQNLTIRGCNIYYVSGDCFQTDPNRGYPLWDNVLIEDSQLWTGPLPEDAAGWFAGEIPGENAVDTKISPDEVQNGYRPLIVLRNIVAYGFEPGYIGNRAAFNIKEQVECRISGVKVYNNEIAFRLRGDTGRGSANVTIINSIAFNNVKIFRTEDGIELLHIYNSTFDKRSSDQYFQNVSGGYDPNGFEMLNSLFMGNKPSDAADPSNLSADPGFFVNSAGHDYHLVNGSPAIDAGVDIAEVTTDYDGNPRTPGSYDVGAFEYDSATGIDDAGEFTPDEFILYPAFPNPFNPSTNLEFKISKAELVTLQVYDLSGRELKTVLHRRLAPGNYTVQWDGRDSRGRPGSSGTYLIRLRAGNQQKTAKVTLIR